MWVVYLENGHMDGNHMPLAIIDYHYDAQTLAMSYRNGKGRFVFWAIV